MRLREKKKAEKKEEGQREKNERKDYKKRGFINQGALIVSLYIAFLEVYLKCFSEIPPIKSQFQQSIRIF